MAAEALDRRSATRRAGLGAPPSPSRLTRQLGSAAILAGLVWVAALPLSHPPLLRWARRHLSSDGVVTAEGAWYLALGLAAVGLALVTGGLLLRRASRLPRGEALPRLFADAGGAATPRYRLLAASASLALVTIAGFALLPPHRWVHGEAGLVETLSVLVLLAAGIVLAAVARRLGVRSAAGAAHALAAGVVLLVAAEEVSWGQTYTRWSTPERWAAINHQRETNLHNLVNPWLDELYALLVAGLLAAFALAAAHRLRGEREAGAARWTLLLPPPSLAPLALAVAAALVPARLAGRGYWHELLELLGYVLLLLWSCERRWWLPASRSAGDAGCRRGSAR